MIRHKLDCAILKLTPGTSSGLNQHLKGIKQQQNRIRFHKVDLSHVVAHLDEDESQRVENRNLLLMQLMRYDVAILLVETKNLSLIRRFLCHMYGDDSVSYKSCPIVAITHQVHPLAMSDLMRLGLTDFIYVPFNDAELRVRLFAAAKKPVIYTPMDESFNYTIEDSGAALEYKTSQDMQQELFNKLFRQSEEDGGAYVFAFTDKEDVCYAKSFKEAKQAVIERFEQGYLRYLLRSTHGNINDAAILAQKHRRSFWQLMRKHQICADEFRTRL